jgi:hypothetical protein
LESGGALSPDEQRTINDWIYQIQKARIDRKEINAAAIISAIPIRSAAAFAEARRFCNEKAEYARMRREGGMNDPWRNNSEYWNSIIDLINDEERNS